MSETTGDQGMEVVDLRFESLRDLQEDFGPSLSQEGFFLSDRSDFAASDVLRFRLMLPGDFVLIEGVGVVVWVRGSAESTPTSPPGAAIGFATLSDQGRELVERIVHSHVESGGQPFNMSRPAENGEGAGVPAEHETLDSPPSSAGAMKFTVRDKSEQESAEEPEISDVDQRLPFEAEVEPELFEPEILDDVAECEETPISQVDHVVPEDSIGSPSFEPLGAADESAESLFLAEAEHVLVQESEPELEPESEPKFEPVLAPETEPEPVPVEPELDLEPNVEIELEPLIESTPVPDPIMSNMEISLPAERDSEPDSQPKWPTADEEDEPPEAWEQPKAKSRSGLIVGLVAVVVLVSAAWVVWTMFPEYLPGGPQSASSSDAVDESLTQENLPPEMIPTLTDEDLEAAVEAAVDAVTAPDQNGESVLAQTEVPVVPDPVAAPASKVVEIKAESAGGGTRVLIRTDGSISEKRISTSALTNPPRILVRISGIDSPYRPYVVPAGTAEVREIRIGHHEETRPPSLWIVLDRTDQDVKIQDVQIDGNAIRVEVGK